MNYEEYIELGLNGEYPLKLILKGYIEKSDIESIGIVAVVYASLDQKRTETVLKDLIKNATEDEYYMVYSVPMDVDITKLEHYPSIAISKDDLS